MIDISLKECYKTVSVRAESVFIEKKSKFIATVIPADTEEKALAFLEEMRKTYSDDGEPSGTAGMPVLDAIRKSGIVDCAVVVTRYFGGTLLGTGGLVHAYGKSAKDGLDAAGIIEKRLSSIMSVTCDYTLGGRLSHFFLENGYIVEDTIYDNQVTYFIPVMVSLKERFIKDITELSNGKAEIKENGTKYVDIKL